MSSSFNPRPFNTDDVKQKLELLQTIEKLGGSAGYSKNPGAFENIVTALDPYDAIALGNAINRLSSNTNPSSQLLKSKLQAQVELHRTDPKLAQKARVSQVLQGVEKLGGYAGFKKYIESPRGQKAAVTSPVAADSDWDDCYAWGWIASALIYTSVVLYADNHTGSGGSWGAGLGVGNLEGNLSHAPWSTLCSAENDFYVESIAGGVGMEFYIDGDYVAQFTGGNIGALVAVGFDGWMDWSEDSD